MSNLARVLRDTGHANEAEPLFHKAIAISEKALGRDHPDTQRYASHYARLLVVTGRAAEALTVAQAALATHEGASGLNHPWTKDSAAPPPTRSTRLAAQRRRRRCGSDMGSQSLRSPKPDEPLFPLAAHSARKRQTTTRPFSLIF
jgi:hypothetical protein